jgi:TolA-binding protein
MSGGGDEPAPDGLWAALRRRYETGKEAVSLIAAEAGLTAQALTARARAEGWKLRGTPRASPPSTRETIARFKALLQKRLADFEAEIAGLTAAANAATAERDIRAMNTLVRTLEKVLELERKERLRRKQQRKAERHFDDAEREALAQKLEGLHRELRQDRPQPDLEVEPDPRGAASQS